MKHYDEISQITGELGFYPFYVNIVSTVEDEGAIIEYESHLTEDQNAISDPTAITEEIERINDGLEYFECVAIDYIQKSGYVLVVINFDAK